MAQDNNDDFDQPMRLPEGTPEARALAAALTFAKSAFADFTIRVAKDDGSTEEWYIRCDRFRVKPRRRE